MSSDTTLARRRRLTGGPAEVDLPGELPAAHITAFGGALARIVLVEIRGELAAANDNVPAPDESTAAEAA